MQATQGSGADVEQRAAAVAAHIYALPEPWRSRFLDLIAQYAREACPGVEPSAEEVLGWLCDEELNARIRLLLRSWTHGGSAL